MLQKRTAKIDPGRREGVVGVLFVKICIRISVAVYGASALWIIVRRFMGDRPTDRPTSKINCKQKRPDALASFAQSSPFYRQQCTATLITNIVLYVFQSRRSRLLTRFFYLRIYSHNNNHICVLTLYVSGIISLSILLFCHCARCVALCLYSYCSPYTYRPTCSWLLLVESLNFLPIIVLFNHY